MAKELLRPPVHFACHPFCDLHEYWILVNRHFEVTLVIERHRINLSEGIFTIKHPSIGAGKQCIGYISYTAFQGCIRFCCRSCPLYPLPPEIGWNSSAFELAIASILHLYVGAWNSTFRVKESNSHFIFLTLCPAFDTGGHDVFYVVVKVSKRGKD